MSKHTKGPWTVDETKAAGAYGVWTDYATHPGHDAAGYGSIICSMLPQDGRMSREERDANALLISAAPDLLAACKTALNCFTENEPESQQHEESPYHFLYAAIAKAEAKENHP